jgi:hypothetical protein
MVSTRSTISKLYVACLMGVGLLTFFLPIVTTDTAVHGRTEWAPFDLLVSRADLWRPAPPPFHNHLVLYQITVTYILMMLAVLVLALPSPRMPLTVIAIVGSAGSVSLFRHAPRSFGWLFYGRSTHSRIWDGDNVVTGLFFGAEGLRCDFAYVVLLCVMPVLALLVMRDRPDPPPLTVNEEDERDLGVGSHR